MQAGGAMTEIGEHKATQDYTPRQRLTSGFFSVFMIGLMAYFAVRSARYGLVSSDESRWLRVPQFVFSGLMALAAGWWAFTLLRRKWTTGRFLLTRAEGLAKMAEHRSKMGAGKPLGPQAKYWVVPLVLMAILVALGIGVLVLSTCTCSDGSQFPLRLRLLIWALAATLMCLPGWFLFKSIRRRLKTGSFLPSEEELAKGRAKCATPKPLKQRILVAGLNWLVAILWTFSAIRGHHSQSQTFPPWVVAALWWFVAAIWTWQVFRPAKPRCGLSITPEEQPKEPQAASS
jgi:hypothetical protein